MTKVVLVDNQNQVLGFLNKTKAHQKQGRLHQAISVLLFNSQGELLIQKRSAKKMLWPGFWSNTCCSHPQPKETPQKAAQRRLFEEMGIKADLKFNHRFIYRQNYQNIGSEYELDFVFTGVSDQKPRPDKKEIADFKFISLKKLEKEIQKNPQLYTPWFKTILKKIKSPDILNS